MWWLAEYSNSLLEREDLGHYPLAAPIHDGHELPDPDDNEKELRECNWILYTMFALAKEIHARSTISQCLAKAFAWNSALAETSVLLWAEDFSDVFNKESFNSLPEHRM
jgi:hypothetical protein